MDTTFGAEQRDDTKNKNLQKEESPFFFSFPPLSWRNGAQVSLPQDPSTSFVPIFRRTHTLHLKLVVVYLARLLHLRQVIDQCAHLFCRDWHVDILRLRITLHVLGIPPRKSNATHITSQCDVLDVVDWVPDPRLSALADGVLDCVELGLSIRASRSEPRLAHSRDLHWVPWAVAGVHVEGVGFAAEVALVGGSVGGVDPSRSSWCARD